MQEIGGKHEKLKQKIVNVHFDSFWIYDFKNLFSGVSQYVENENIGRKHEKLKTENLILLKTKPQLTQPNLTHANPSQCSFE